MSRDCPGTRPFTVRPRGAARRTSASSKALDVFRLDAPVVAAADVVDVLDVVVRFEEPGRQRPDVELLVLLLPVEQLLLGGAAAAGLFDRAVVFAAKGVL